MHDVDFLVKLSDTDLRSMQRVLLTKSMPWQQSSMPFMHDGDFFVKLSDTDLRSMQRVLLTKSMPAMATI